jgi:two-component system nitrate/nitrite response regulator NarL
MSDISCRPVQVFLVSRPMHCWGLERLIQSAHPRIELRGSSHSLASTAQSCAFAQVDVILAEAETPEDFDILPTIAERTAAKLLVVTGSRETKLHDKAMLAGARGVLKTDDAPASLLKALEKVHDGELWIDRGATSRIFLEMARQKAAEGDDPEKTKIATLTMRERQTIAAVAGDAKAPAKVIAQRLCISEHTLRNHLTSIYSKLEVSNRTDLYAFATRHRLTELR